MTRVALTMRLLASSETVRHYLDGLGSVFPRAKEEVIAAGGDDPGAANIVASVIFLMLERAQALGMDADAIMAAVAKSRAFYQRSENEQNPRLS